MAKLDPQRSDTALLVAYGVPVAPSQFLFVLTSVYFVKFGTDVLLVSPAALASIYGFSRLWDAISDPMAGFLSDRTRLAIGRRRSWLLGSSLPMALTALMVWHPPAELAGLALLVWLTIGLFGFSTAFTAFEVPHNALGAELTDQPEVRARLFGLRTWLFILGGYAALTLGIGAIRTAADPRQAAVLVVGGVGILYVLTAVFAVWRLRERSDFSGRGGRSPFGAYRDLLANPHARTVLGAVLCEYLGTGGSMVLTAYVFHYVLDAAHLTEVAFLVMGVAQVVGVPIWVRLMGRLERARVWQIAMGCAAVGCGIQFAVGLFGGSPLLYVVISCLYALGASATGVVGSALLADVVDSDELETGERKEGVYFAGWHFTRKAMQGMMVIVAGLALEGAGFVPNESQNPATFGTILGLGTLAPAIGYGAGALLLGRVRLDRVRMAEIREILVRRRSEAAGAQDA